MANTVERRAVDDADDNFARYSALPPKPKRLSEESQSSEEGHYEKIKSQKCDSPPTSRLRRLIQQHRHRYDLASSVMANTVERRAIDDADDNFARYSALPPKPRRLSEESQSSEEGHYEKIKSQKCDGNDGVNATDTTVGTGSGVDGIYSIIRCQSFDSNDSNDTADEQGEIV
jgi:hypothetical protein